MQIFCTHFLETKTVTKISVGKMSVYNMPEHPCFERIIIRVVSCLVSQTNYFEVLSMVLSTFIYISWGREENVAVFRCHRQQKGVEEFEDTRRKTTVRWKKSSFGAFVCSVLRVSVAVMTAGKINISWNPRTQGCLDLFRYIVIVLFASNFSPFRMNLWRNNDVIRHFSSTPTYLQNCKLSPP